MTLDHTRLAFPKSRALSVEAEAAGASLSVILAQAGIQCCVPGFRVAAYGLARNDGLVVFVIPAKAGIQGVWYGLGILFLSSEAKNLAFNAEERCCASLNMTLCQPLFG